MPPTYRANILPFTFFFNAQKWKARKINFWVVSGSVLMQR
jgi:hypothetical protein